MTSGVAMETGALIDEVHEAPAPKKLISSSPFRIGGAVSALVLVGLLTLVVGGSSNTRELVCPTTPAYDTSAVDWPALASDLETFVTECGCAPILVRLSWHDSGTYKAEDDSGGSRAAQRFPDGESLHGANAGLGIARGLLQPYKEKYPAVGLADLWALAAIQAIKVSGGPSIPFRAGRTDIKTSAECVEEGRLPDGDKGASHIRQVFGRMGFTDGEIVALSGGHSLGACHADRSGFSTDGVTGPWDTTPLTFDNAYFKLLVECDWYQITTPNKNTPQMACDEHPELMMLTTDYALVSDPAFKPITETYARDSSAFFKDYMSAFQRLQENGHHNLVEVALA